MLKTRTFLLLCPMNEFGLGVADIVSINNAEQFVCLKHECSLVQLGVSHVSW